MNSSLTDFVTSASKGMWWNKLSPHPDKVHVYIAPLLGGTLYAVSDKKELNSQELSVGAGIEEIQQVVRLLEETNGAKAS